MMLCIHAVMYETYYVVLLSLCAGPDQAFLKENFLGLKQQFYMLKISSIEIELYELGRK